MTLPDKSENEDPMVTYRRELFSPQAEKSVALVWVFNLVIPGLGLGYWYAFGPKGLALLFIAWVIEVMNFGNSSVLIFFYFLLSIVGSLKIIAAESLRASQRASIDQPESAETPENMEFNFRSAKKLDNRPTSTRSSSKMRITGQDDDDDRSYALNTLEFKAREAEKRLRQTKHSVDFSRQDDQVKMVYEPPLSAKVAPQNPILREKPDDLDPDLWRQATIDDNPVVPNIVGSGLVTPKPPPLAAPDAPLPVYAPDASKYEEDTVRKPGGISESYGLSLGQVQVAKYSSLDQTQVADPVMPSTESEYPLPTIPGEPQAIMDVPSQMSVISEMGSKSVNRPEPTVVPHTPTTVDSILSSLGTSTPAIGQSAVDSMLTNLGVSPIGAVNPNVKLADKCPKCGADRFGTFSFCLSCGQNLES